MTSAELAKKLDVNYQTVCRILVKAVKQRPELKPERKDGAREIGPELEAMIIDGVRRLSMRDPRWKIRSTSEQRKEWTDRWGAAFEQSPKDWEYFALIIVAIEYSKKPGWLSTSARNSERIGDVILGIAKRLVIDECASTYDGFTGWLMETGFKA